VRIVFNRRRGVYTQSRTRCRETRSEHRRAYITVALKLHMVLCACISAELSFYNGTCSPALREGSSGWNKKEAPDESFARSAFVLQLACMLRKPLL